MSTSLAMPFNRGKFCFVQVCLLVELSTSSAINLVGMTMAMVLPVVVVVVVISVVTTEICSCSGYNGGGRANKHHSHFQ